MSDAPKSNDFELGAALTGLALDGLFKSPLPVTPSGGQPESRLIHPELGVQSRGVGNPQVSGSLTAPMGTGDVSLEGQYQKRGATATPEWGARATFRKEF
jgi:hypothetical protein